MLGHSLDSYYCVYSWCVFVAGTLATAFVSTRIETSTSG